MLASRVSHQFLQYMSWKLDPFRNSRNTLQIRWNQIYAYTSPPFALIGKVLRKGRQDHSSIILITLTWQTQSWFPGLLRMLVSKSFSITPRKERSFKRSTRVLTPNDLRKSSKSSGLIHLREKLQAEEVSRRASVLITNFRHTGSLKHYESARGEWVSWCSRKEMCPTRFSISYILDILAELFDESLQCNIIEPHRSPTSTFKKIGDHSRVSNLMSGIFNQRPLKE